MFGRLFDNPLIVIAILLVILLLFGAPKLPGMARSLGQSMRIFKSEVKEMKKDDRDEGSDVVIDGKPVQDGQDPTRDGAAGTPRDPDQRPGHPPA
jgi:sec-independent protein translocase protein TatA